jgi:hypothetical protein
MRPDWKKCQAGDPDYIDANNPRWWADARGHNTTPGYLGGIPGPTSQDNDGHYWTVTRVSDSNTIPERFVAQWVHPTAAAPA